MVLSGCTGLSSVTINNMTKGMVKACTGIIAMAFVFLLQGCGDSQNAGEQYYDSPQKGRINISVDESFKPVVEEHIKVYQSTFPEADIHATYKSEADCLRDLQTDSTRLVLVARGLNEEEIKFYKNKLGYKPVFDILAFDAVDLVVNIESTDSVFTLERIKNLLSGVETGKPVVVDGNNATSTVRFLMDSVLKGKSFGSNVTAAKGSKAVLEYIAANKNAVGFIGSSWFGNDQDPAQKAWNKKIKLALVECRTCEKNIFAKPSQATLSYGQYPLVRPLFYILKENSTGLGTGFINFMSLERGQLIFRRAYLVPAKMYFGVRKGDLTE
jgi:phosphate transport system substrate-binding protein